MWVVSLTLCALIASTMQFEPSDSSPSTRIESSTNASNASKDTLKMPKATKHVRFSKSLEEVMPRLPKTWTNLKSMEKTVDKNTMWWRQRDIKRFKEESSMLSVELQKADRCHVVPYSYTNTIMKIFNACLAEPDTVSDKPSCWATTQMDRKHLDRWMGVGTLRVGLEKKIVRSMAKGCSALRAQVIAAVLAAQKRSKGNEEAIREASLSGSR